MVETLKLEEESKSEDQLIAAKDYIWIQKPPSLPFPKEKGKMLVSFTYKPESTGRNKVI